ncbi:copper-binding protein [Saccharothrix syringae]|uniref:Copper-binding protein n=1 Tax=Saccharothrix syringae TaxID=103733 RepID=A0A5Q0HDE5_SACSY|nr:copper-binding protein [Saccharothrix syringae]
MARNFARACAALVLALLPVLGGQGTAAAHATLVSTAPAGWQVLDTTPAEVALTFSEPVDLGLATVRLLGPAGDVVPTGEPAHAGDRPEAVVVPVPRALSDGTYTVSWQVTSADSHPVRGAFVFSVGRPSAATGNRADVAAEPGGAVVALHAATRWLSFAGFALLVGAAFHTAWCQARPAPGRRVRVLLVGGWWTLLAATVLALLLYGPYATGRPLGDAVDPALVADTSGTRMGVALLARLLLLGLVGFGLLRHLRRADESDVDPAADTAVARRRRVAVVLAVAGLLALTWSTASHSAAGGLVGLALAADAAHLTAMAVWLGGLVAVAAVAVRPDDVPALRVVVPRFSRAAPVAVAVVVVTGVFQSWRLVGTPDALVGTAYGRVLIGKLALVAALVALGAAARRWVRRHYGFPVVTVSDKRRAARGPGDGPVRRFGRLVAVEAGIAAAVLGLTAALVNTETAAVARAQARQAAAAPPAAAPGEPAITDFDAGGAAGRGRVAVLAAPGSTGATELHVAVLDERGQPKGVPEVRAALTPPQGSSDPLDVPLRYGGVPGHYISDALPMAVSGRWEVSLAVRTSDVDEAIVQLPLGIP